jgi:dTMP kinase
LVRRTGKLVAVEGIDQSGKRTQSLLLARKLRSCGRLTSMHSFPDYRTPVGRQLRFYLSGKTHFDFHVVHLLYAANRWEKAGQIASQLRAGRDVVINRYSPSNLAYGVAHGLKLDLLNSLERDLPEPDLVLVLDIDPRTSYERKKRFRDVHEGSFAYLSKVRRTYLRLAPRYHWRVLDGERESRFVHKDIWKEVSRRI